MGLPLFLCIRHRSYNILALLAKLLRLIPGHIIEILYYSRFQQLFVSIYDQFMKNETIRTYKIFNDIYIDVDPRKLSERAIPLNAYETSITQLFSSLIRKEVVVVDVGAWIGYYTLIAARSAKKVIALEADYDNYKRLVQNIEKNGFSNVTALNIAVGEGSSEGILKKGPGSSWHRVDLEGTGEVVKIQNLDKIIDGLEISKIDVLIMDIEGDEYYALKGLESSLSNRIVKNLICEVHPNILTQKGVQEQQILEYLSEKEYALTVLGKTGSKSRPYHIYAKAPSFDNQKLKL
jgi:FkbM family methyltransferase